MLFLTRSIRTSKILCNVNIVCRNKFRCYSNIIKDTFNKGVMSKLKEEDKKRVYKLVLTGGPCGGKTTGQVRLSTFFENLGWKVYRVPETASILISGGVKFQDMSDDEAYRFQLDLIYTMMQIENTFFDLAESSNQNCLIICDRGVMDASAYMSPEQWERMKKENKWNEVDLRDNRYNQAIHMVSAAKGAEDFYRIDNHITRYEGIEHARQLDDMTAQAWVGHPYYDIVDNSTGFERKVVRMIAAVCNRLGIEAKDRLSFDSRKRKFLIAKMPDDSAFPQYRDFTVRHDYLITPNQRMQARIRKRGQNGNYTYTHTIRRPEINKECPELRMQITRREYELLLAQKDSGHSTIFKSRRCFVWNSQYFQLDFFLDRCHSRSRGLIILETYTTQRGDDLALPDFMDVITEVTDNPDYSMYNLSKKDITSPDLPSLLRGNSSPNLAGMEIACNGHHGPSANGEGETANGEGKVQTKASNKKIDGLKSEENGLDK